jgi:Domain of unknown function (DUF4214)
MRNGLSRSMGPYGGATTIAWSSAFLLSACGDPAAPRLDHPISLAVSTVPSAPYPATINLPSILQQQIKYGVNGHSVTQMPYIDTYVDGMGRTFDGLRGLGGNVYRFDVPHLIGSEAAARANRTHSTLLNARARGVRVVVVLPDHPQPWIGVDSAFKLGRNYALSVIPILQSYLDVIDAVELGNEFDTQMKMVTAGFDGSAANQYDPVKLNTGAAHYRGMRSAFLAAGGGVSSVPRLISGTQGHTYWVIRALELASVPITRNGTDGIAWHWYTTGSGAYEYLTSVTSGTSSVISRLRGRYNPNGFRLWVTETNFEYPASVTGLCPSDNQVPSVAAQIGRVMTSHSLLPEVEAVLAYEIFDQSTTGLDDQSRYGFAVSGCAAVGDQIGYKLSADSLAFSIYRLRDTRKVLATAVVLALGGGQTIVPSDTSALPATVRTASTHNALFGAVETSISRSRWLTNLYQSVHRRAPDAGGLAYWLSQLGQPGWDRHRVEYEFYASEEYFAANGGTNDSFVWALYRDIHGRQNDPDGVAYWTWVLNTGAPRYEVTKAFLESPEHIDVVVRTQHQRILGRDPTTAEMDFWRPRLFASATLEDLSYTLVRSDEALRFGIRERISAHRQ